MTHRFRVKLQNFACQALTPQGRSSSADPYLVVKFDGFREFKLEIQKKSKFFLFY